MVNCVKLGREAEGLDLPPMPGELGKKLWENVSKEAWQQWIKLQTMIINENRLNLADAAHRVVHPPRAQPRLGQRKAGAGLAQQGALVEVVDDGEPPPAARRQTPQDDQYSPLPSAPAARLSNRVSGFTVPSRTAPIDGSSSCTTVFVPSRRSVSATRTRMPSVAEAITSDQAPRSRRIL